MKDRTFVLHPVLCALAPVLTLWANNAEHVELYPMLLVCAASMLAAALLTGVFAILTRDVYRGAIIGSLFVLLFFLNGQAFDFVVTRGWIKHPRHADIVLGAGCLALFIAAWFAVVRMRFDPRKPTRILNIASSILVLLAVAGMPYKRVFGAAASQWIEAPDRLPAMLDKSNPSPAAPIPDDDPSKPDVYYIILDGYAREDVLKSLLGFDNSQFIRWLKDRGFYVAENSAANYPITHFSLASSLNLDYMDQVAACLPPDSDSQLPYYELIQNNLAGRIFRSQGYRFIHFATNFRATEDSQIADEVIRRYPSWMQNEFIEVLVRNSALRPFGPKVAEIHLNAFERLSDVPQQRGPKFVFTHFVLPHPPYVFDQDGNIRQDVLLDLDFRHRTQEPQDRIHYVNQLIFTNKKIMETIDAILANSRQKPVILLQSDHGSRFLFGGTPRALPKREAFLRERFPVLNAYYFPSELPCEIYPSISPVNSFRVVFNHLFGTDYELLEDRHYIVWHDFGIHLVDVTDTARKGAPTADDIARLEAMDAQAER